MESITQLRIKRPLDVQSQTFNATPSYTKHLAYEDKLAILVCQIRIWKAKNKQWFDIPSNCLIIRECESIEVSNSAKELINKAVVRFPRGTVINISGQGDKEVKTGSKSDDTQKTETLQKATNDGEVITPQSAKDKENNVSTVPMAVSYDDKGLIDFNRTKQEPALLNPNNIATGNRIEIRVGYAYSETEFKKMNSTVHTDASMGMDMIFTGFVTSVSVSTPLEIECTNMAHLLTTIGVPNVKANETLTVKDFLDDDGRFHLLKDTGITLAECSKKLDLQVKGGVLTNNITVADVLTEWNKAGILCIMEDKQDGTVQLRVGLTYFAGRAGSNLPNNDKKYITYNGGNNTVKIIQFDWDVAQDKLTLKRNDKKYLAVRATGRPTATETIQLTIRKNADSDDEGWMVDTDGQWNVVNERKLSHRKKEKTINGAKSTHKVSTQITNKVDMDKYTVIPYQSITKNVTRDQLIEEAKQYWAKYSPNGLSGSIEIFGDVFIQPTDVIGLIDPRQPQKDGYYYVESVDTTFGVDGYRRELKMPFKVASFTKPIEIIE